MKKFFITALMVFVSLISAAPTNAQSMSLLDLIDTLVKAGIISPDKALVVKAKIEKDFGPLTPVDQGGVFTQDLTWGSQNTQVSLLQQKLGVPVTGIFKTETLIAVKNFQKENGLPASGYVGRFTRAKLNSMSAIIPTLTGKMAVYKSSTLNPTLHSGDMLANLFSVNIKAELSDVSIQRMKLNFGPSSSAIYKQFSTIYITNSEGAILSQVDVNNTTLSKENGNYYLTLGGFSYLVPKNISKDLSIKANIYSSLTDMSTRTVSIDVDGIQGQDSFGFSRYAPTARITQDITFAN